MIRGALIAIGLVDLLAPGKLVEAAEGIALENPEECDLRSWVLPVARVEGLLFLVLALGGERSYSGFKRFLGVVGLPALLFPKLYVDFAAGLAYADPEACEWRSWCYPFTRLVGLVYVLVALDELRER